MLDENASLRDKLEGTDVLNDTESGDQPQNNEEFIRKIHVLVPLNGIKPQLEAVPELDAKPVHDELTVLV